ncbi:MAG: TrkA C-terminal domain-containing protein [Fibrobacterota bacterium]
MIPLISLIVIVILSILINKVATVALTHTGLPREVARFQARSAFTGAGFTTNEAETVVNHPVRRRVIMVLMLLGSVGLVSAVASLIQIRATFNFWYGIILISGGIVIIWILVSSQTVDRWFSYVVDIFLKRFTGITEYDYTRLLRVSGEYEITEIRVNTSSWLSDKPLKTLGLQEEGIMVLGVFRKEGFYMGDATSRMKIRQGDTVVLYGDKQAILDVRNRPNGPEGDLQHKAAVLAETWTRRQEQKEERNLEGL